MNKARVIIFQTQRSYMDHGRNLQSTNAYVRMTKVLPLLPQDVTPGKPLPDPPLPQA